MRVPASQKAITWTPLWGNPVMFQAVLKTRERHHHLLMLIVILLLVKCYCSISQSKFLLISFIVGGSSYSTSSQNSANKNAFSGVNSDPFTGTNLRFSLKKKSLFFCKSFFRGQQLFHRQWKQHCERQPIFSIIELSSV